MIVVIADDFTGAAEIGGIGLKYGLKVVIETNLENHVNADLLIIATDTRSGSIKNAILESEIIAEAVKKLQPELIFKKIDSVLRGYILEETSALMNGLELSNALIVPANPLLKRIITQGQYYIDGEPIHNTSFSNDPDFHGKSAHVLEILSRNGLAKELIIRRPGSEQSGDRIIVGEASSSNDLSYWAENVTRECLPCGAAGFFESLLQNRGLECQPPVSGYTHSSGKKSLFVCGSAFSKSRDAVTIAKTRGHAVSYMPDKVFDHTAYQQGIVEWKADILNKFSVENHVIIAIRQPVVRSRDISNHLKISISELISQLMVELKFQELIIEGGATASAILQKLEMTRLIPVHQYAHGVIRMKVENKPNINITMKPGSYVWPEEVWNFK